VAAAKPVACRSATVNLPRFRRPPLSVQRPPEVEIPPSSDPGGHCLPVRFIRNFPEAGLRLGPALLFEVGPRQLQLNEGRVREAGSEILEASAGLAGPAMLHLLQGGSQGREDQGLSRPGGVPGSESLAFSLG